MTGENGSIQIHSFKEAPRRVVSLVPSMTESLIDLGMGSALVGLTEYCRPGEAYQGVPRVGGTRTVDVEAVRALNPELVIANQEENPRSVVEALEQAGLRVWVTFPRSVAAAIDILWVLARLFRSAQAGLYIKTIEDTLTWTALASESIQPMRTFCPIWYDEHPQFGVWMMSFNSNTYAHDLLQKCGGQNVFASRERRYPLAADLGHGQEEEANERDRRYPRLALAEILESQPDLILLPDEPFSFEAEHQASMEQLLAETPALRAGRVRRIDGRLLTWHGTRLAHALRSLPEMLQDVT